MQGRTGGLPWRPAGCLRRTGTFPCRGCEMSKDTFEGRLDDFVSRAFWPAKAFASVLEEVGKDTESFALP